MALIGPDPDAAAFKQPNHGCILSKNIDLGGSIPLSFL
jgi:hypothetical protein